MSKSKIVITILCVVFLFVTTPLAFYSTYKDGILTEKILLKKETITSSGEPQYYFILKNTGSLSVTPQAYLTHNVKDTFSYAPYSLKKKKKLSDAYALMFLLLRLPIIMYYAWNYYTCINCSLIKETVYRFSANKIEQDHKYSCNLYKGT